MKGGQRSKWLSDPQQALSISQSLDSPLEGFLKNCLSTLFQYSVKHEEELLQSRLYQSFSLCFQGGKKADEEKDEEEEHEVILTLGLDQETLISW